MPARYRHPPHHHLLPRTRGFALLAVAAAMVPWTAMLWRELPRHGHSLRSRNWWVALDASEAAAFALAGYLHLSGDRRQIPVLHTVAGLLLLDGAADVTLAHTARERGAAFLMLPVELAGAAWCLRIARFAHYELAGFDTEKRRDGLRPAGRKQRNRRAGS